MNYYTAKEVSEILKKEDESMTLRKIRYYTQLDMLPPLEIVKNKPKYTDKHIEYLRAIRTMQKTGDKLDDIGGKLKSLDLSDITNISKQESFYSTDHLLGNTVHQINDDISMTISNRLSSEEQQSIVRIVSHALKK